MRKIHFYILKVMKFTSKTRASDYLLSSTFFDKFWKSHLDILYVST